MKIGLLLLLCALAAAGVAVTVFRPWRQEPDPFAEPFGDAPHLGDRL
jgi:hypothetical protein